MNGTDYLLATNIVLYLLGGDKVLAEILNNKKPYLSLFQKWNYWEFRN